MFDCNQNILVLVYCLALFQTGSLHDRADALWFIDLVECLIMLGECLDLTSVIYL